MVETVFGKWFTGRLFRQQSLTMRPSKVTGECEWLMTYLR